MFSAKQIPKNKYWKELQCLLKSNEPHAALRKLAVKIAKENCSNLSIIIQVNSIKTILKTFATKKEKTDYFEKQNKVGVWGDDPLLYLLLQGLGYQLIIHISSQGITKPFQVKPYVALEGTTGLTIHLVNYGANAGGSHWELFGKNTPTDGNCMFHAVSQQIAIDFPELIPKEKLPESECKGTRVGKYTLRKKDISRESDSHFVDKNFFGNNNRKRTHEVALMSQHQESPVKKLRRK